MRSFEELCYASLYVVLGKESDVEEVADELGKVEGGKNVPAQSTFKMNVEFGIERFLISRVMTRALQ